jgi:hypothetical protein
VRPSLEELEARVWGPPVGDDYPPGPPGHGCASFTQAADGALEWRRLAILARWQYLFATHGAVPTRRDVQEFVAVARALGRSEAEIENFTRHFPAEWFQWPYRRPRWRELHGLYDSTSPFLERPND